MLYTPMLPEAASGTLEPRHVVVPLRMMCPRSELLLGRATAVDTDRRRVTVQTDEDLIGVEYSNLVIALGSVSRTLPVPGLAEHALGFKSLADAIGLRNRLLQTLEAAESLDDARAREAWLTYVFVGAGYAGLEGLAELQDFAADVIELYPRCATQGMRWILVEARERVMPEISPDLADFAARELRYRGIEIRTRTTLEEVTERTATLSGGETLPCRTVVWTAGVKPPPVTARLGVPLTPQGRI